MSAPLRRPRAALAHAAAPALALALALPACVVPVVSTSDGSPPEARSSVRTWHYEPDLPVSTPPFQEVHANWKQRMDQPYVFLEFEGPYPETGRLLPIVQRMMREQGLEPSGAPFGLFFDDPGLVPATELRSRACVPVDRPAKTSGALRYEVLPSTTVVYAVAGGAYPEVPRCYPGLYAYMARMGWTENGPIREIYLIPPDAVDDFDELRCEVQIPVAYGG